MRFRVLAAAVVAALAFAGCGEKADYVRFAETEGIYVDVGDLVYQVQLSRYLNPGDVEDREYLEGLPAGTTPVGKGDTWFGVWMRVKNYTDRTIEPATDFTVTDTEGNKYTPIELAPTNVFRYNPLPLLPSHVLPTPDSAASSGPIQGALILFRLKVESLQNRPLVLTINKPGSIPAHIDLDL